MPVSISDIENLIRFIILPIVIPLISGGAAGAVINHQLEKKRNAERLHFQEEQAKKRSAKVLESLQRAEPEKVAGKAGCVVPH